LNSYVFPGFLNPQNALLTQPLYVFQATYHPKFPYALQYNLNLEREIAPGTFLTAGYFGARGNHLLREIEANPFESALGHRYNPNLPSPLLEDRTDAPFPYGKPPPRPPVPDPHLLVKTPGIPSSCAGANIENGLLLMVRHFAEHAA